MLPIKVKYKPGVEKLKYIEDKSDWIDLRCNEDIDLKVGDFKLIDLGVAIQLPEGYEALMVPRSSTFKNYGILMTNSIGVIDNKYCGPNDFWRFPALAMRDSHISKGDRICQFRIIKNMPNLDFIESDLSHNDDRGGLGSTGVK